MKKNFFHSQTFKWIITGALVVFFLILVALIFTMIITVRDLKIDADNNNFGLFMSQITIFITLMSLSFFITIAVPYFITKNTITSIAKKVIETDFQKDLVSSIKKADRIDSHLSRMVAFLLYENKYYYWAIGWAIKSLTKYIENVENSEDSFLSFLVDEVIQKAVVAIIKNKPDKTLKRFPIKDFKSLDNSILGIKLRIIKDSIIFSYSIKTELNRKVKSNFIKSFDKKRKIEYKVEDKEKVVNISFKEIFQLIHIMSYYDLKNSEKFSSLDEDEREEKINNLIKKYLLDDEPLYSELYFRYEKRYESYLKEIKGIHGKMKDKELHLDKYNLRMLVEWVCKKES